MRIRRLALFGPIALALLVSGCASSPTSAPGVDGSPEEIYLAAVCKSGQERVVFALLAQGYQQGQGIKAEQVIAAASTAITATRDTVDTLRSGGVEWPSVVAEDVQTVASQEEIVADDLESVAASDEPGLDDALQTFFDRPDSSGEAGERVRAELDLGQPGDCPVSPASEKAFVATVQRFAPTIYERGDQAVIALGREICVVRSLGLSQGEEIDQVMAMGLTEVQAATLIEASTGYLCEAGDDAANSASPTSSTDAVDAFFDEFIAGNLILTQQNPKSDAQVIAQFAGAQAKFMLARDVLIGDMPGVPDTVKEAVLTALDEVLASMSAFTACLESPAFSNCNTEIDRNTELSNALGREAAALIPYGSRSGEEIIAALQGEDVTTANGDASVNPGTGSVSQLNALRKAEEYLAFTAFSRQGLIEQLEYEGFSTADATYAVDAVGANWNEQAAKKAREYLDMMAFSRSGLIDQLVFEGFSPAQAAYGADSVGL